MKKEVQWMFSSILILSAFFLGIYFEKGRETPLNQENEKPIVNLIEKSNGFEIRKNSSNIDIFINGKELEGTGIIIPKKAK